MHLHWHIALKDLHRLRIPLAIWSTLQLLAQLGPVLVWSLPTLTPKQTEFWLYTIASIHALHWLAAFDFATRLIQEDSTSRTDAFWRTRPISGLRLLTTKLLALVVFTALAALPAFISSLVISPTPYASAARFIDTTLQVHLVFAALAVPFAALTRSYRQSLIVSIITTVAILVIVIGAQVIYDPSGTDFYQPRLTLAALIMLTATVATMINQYSTGRLVRSLRIVVLGALATALVLAFWPWRFPLSRPALPLASEEPAETRALTLVYEKSTLRNEPQSRLKSKRPVLTLDFTVAGFPSGHFLSRQAIYHHWQANAAPSFRNLRKWTSPDADARVILGVIPSPRPLASVQVQSQISETFAALLRANRPPAPYRGDLVFALRRAEVTDIPLPLEQEVSKPHAAIRVIKIDPRGGRLRILERRSMHRSRLMAVEPEYNQFILYNPRTGETLRGFGSSFAIPPLQYHELTFGPIQGPNVIGRAEPLTDDFLRYARLVKISFPVVGTFARTVEIPELKPKFH